MKMSDVKVGMRLRSTLPNCDEEIEVTEIIPPGFKYRIPDDRPVVSPHWSMPMLRDGHEHFGVSGNALYEPVSPPSGWDDGSDIPDEFVVKIAEMIEAASGLNPLSARDLSIDIIHLVKKSSSTHATDLARTS